MDLLVYDPKKKKMVLAGKYDENTGIFFKECTGKHWMKIRAGFGISEEVIGTLSKMGCKYIRIKFGKEIRQVVFDIWSYMKTEGFGHDKQKFFGWERMSVIQSNQETFI